MTLYLSVHMFEKFQLVSRIIYISINYPVKNTDLKRSCCFSSHCDFCNHITNYSTGRKDLHWLLACCSFTTKPNFTWDSGFMDNPAIRLFVCYLCRNSIIPKSPLTSWLLTSFYYQFSVAAFVCFFLNVIIHIRSYKKVQSKIKN